MVEMVNPANTVQDRADPLVQKKGINAQKGRRDVVVLDCFRGCGRDGFLEAEMFLLELTRGKSRDRRVLTKEAE